MNFIDTITSDDLDTLRPEVFEHWTKLITDIRARMRLRRYELVTFAALLELKCST
jgi:hypothetical protein